MYGSVQNTCESAQEGREEKRPRTAFTDNQKAVLEGEFNIARYPGYYARKFIADRLGLTVQCVQVRTIFRYKLFKLILLLNFIVNRFSFFFIIMFKNDSVMHMYLFRHK